MSHKSTRERNREANNLFLVFLIFVSLVFFFIGKHSAAGRNQSASLFDLRWLNALVNGQHEVQPHEDGPLKTLCSMSRNLQSYPDFFSALGLYPFSSVFYDFREGTGTNARAENIVLDANTRVRMKGILYHPDIWTATEALLDKHRLSAYLGWATYLGDESWVVNWELQCAGI